MPGSTASAPASTTSSQSGRSKTRQYHTVSFTSHVDETLFGSSPVLTNHKTPHCCVGRLPIETEASQRKCKGKGNGRCKGKREVYQHITRDLIRNIIIPSEDPSGHSMVLPQQQFMEIQQRAIVESKEERQALLQQAKLAKLDAMEEVQHRKAEMKHIDIMREKNVPLNDLEMEAKEKQEHLLAAANAMRVEQEDEIKHLNEMILNAKCHAVRDAQILEKNQIAKELVDEEKRLDTLMEVDRQLSIRQQEEVERQRRHEQLNGAAQLMEQIHENQQERLFELERKDQENVQMQRHIETIMEEDQAAVDRMKATQQRLKEDLDHANQDILHRKQETKLQEQAEMDRVLDFQRRKAEREAAYEREQEAIRLEKEKETARMRALQERAADEQAERDALRAKRAQEQAEREWRAKEAEEARNKAETNAMLEKARHKQMKQKEHYLAVEALHERQDFERVLRAQKELVEKQKMEESQMYKQRQAHVQELRAQIREKEQQRIAERQAFFEEGFRLDEEAQARRARLDAVKRKKIQDLREAGIPDKYLSTVERKMNRPQHGHA